MSLELPRVTLAEAAAAALSVLCAVTTEVVLRSYPGAPIGVGLFVGALTATWACLDTVQPARSLRRAVWLPDDTWRLEFRDGGAAAARLGRGTRMLGRTLVLEWRLPDRSVVRWLTSRDVDDAGLRTVAARLACAARLRIY
jgi:hypothetical protein